MEESEKNQNKAAEAWITHKGPIVLKGNFIFRDSSGKITSGEQELYICRCGGSKNKPWCDDSHLQIGVPD